jgi:hypothetical protein
MTAGSAAKSGGPTPTGTGDWWVILEASSGPPISSGFIVVQGTATAIHAKYGTGPQVMGPYPTKAAAEAAGQNVSQPFGPQPPTGLPGGIPNPFGFLAALGWIQEIGHWVGLAVSAVTDIHMWISVGWIGLGFWMLVIGILLWLKVPQRAARAARDVAAAAAVAA